MARRTVQNIYDEMVAKKAELEALNGITSTSDFALWKTLFWVHAFAIWVWEGVWENEKIELEAAALLTQYGTMNWYKTMLLKYQHGDSLTEISDGVWGYAVIDESKQIVKYVSVVERSDSLLIKVAKDATGSPAKLTTSELSGYTSYVGILKVMGTDITIISEDADDIRLDITIEVDNKVIDNTGAEITTGDEVVLDAIKGYVANLDFNRIYRASSLVDAVQAVEGVVDVTLNEATSRFDANPFEEILITHQPNAGYYELDEAGSTITIT